MFFEDVKAAWLAGKVRIGLPPVGLLASDDSQARIEADGFVGLKTKLLSRTERRDLVQLMRCEHGQLERDLPFSSIRQWVQDVKAVLLTGPCGTGKSSLAAAALPDAVIVDGRTADLSKPHWFWHQVTKDPSRPLVIDEPHILPPLVLEELLKVLKEQARGYLVIHQDDEGPRFESLWRSMSNTPIGFSDHCFQWVRLSSFDGQVARAKWAGR